MQSPRSALVVSASMPTSAHHCDSPPQPWQHPSLEQRAGLAIVACSTSAKSSGNRASSEVSHQLRLARAPKRQRLTTSSIVDGLIARLHPYRHRRILISGIMIRIKDSVLSSSHSCTSLLFSRSSWPSIKAATRGKLTMMSTSSHSRAKQRPPRTQRHSPRFTLPCSAN